MHCFFRQYTTLFLDISVFIWYTLCVRETTTTFHPLFSVCMHVFAPLLQSYSNLLGFKHVLLLSCCLKAHLHVSPNRLGSERCQTELVHSMRVHHTIAMNSLILAHHFEITLNTSQVRLKPKKIKKKPIIQSGP